MTRSLDPNLIPVVIEREDIADRALAQHDEKHKDDKIKLSRYVIFEMADEGVPVPEGGLAREKWLKEMADIESGNVDEVDIDGSGLDIQRRRPPGGYNDAEYGDPPIESAQTPEA